MIKLVNDGDAQWKENDKTDHSGDYVLIKGTRHKSTSPTEMAISQIVIENKMSIIPVVAFSPEKNVNRRYPRIQITGVSISNY